MTTQSTFRNRSRILAVASALAFPVSTHAASKTWDGDAADLLWNTPANWNLDALPLSGDDAGFSGNVGTVKLDTDPTISTLSMTVATGQTIAFNTDAVSPHTLTINSGITTVGTAGTLTFNAGTNPNFLTLALGGNNTWDLARTLTVNSVVSGAFSITKLGSGSVTLSNTNSLFTGGIIHRQNTINLAGLTSSDNIGTGTFTWANLAGGLNNTLTLNVGASKTLGNNFVNDNAATVTGTQYAQFSYSGGTRGYRVTTFNGAFSTGDNFLAGAQSLFLNANTGATGLGEGSLVFNGDWSGYLAGAGNTQALRINDGAVVIGAQQAVAGSGVYQLQGNTATASSKLILAGDYTMGNTVIFGGGANGMRNSAGSRNAAATTATLSGAVTVSDVDGGNLFSQNSGAMLKLSGLLSGANALRVNDSYTFTSADVTNTLETPGGTVALTRAAGSTLVGGVTVVNGTLLVANASGNGTGTGAVTIGVTAPASSGNAGTGVATSRALTAVDTAVAATLVIGQPISGTNIAAGAVITGITLGNGAANSTVVMSALPTGAVTSFEVSASTTAATLQLGDNDATGSLAPASAITIHSGSKLVFKRSDATVQGTAFSAAPITGAGGVEQAGAGTLDLTGPQNYATLTATAGVTNVDGSFTGGTATVNANATLNFGADQTLAALHIGAGATVTLDLPPHAPAFAAEPPDFAADAPALAALVQAVPEPSTAMSALTGLGLLRGLRRRRS